VSAILDLMETGPAREQVHPGDAPFGARAVPRHKNAEMQVTGSTDSDSPEAERLVHMPSYVSLRRLYHFLVPRPIRRLPVFTSLGHRDSSALASHDLIYSKDYFLHVVEGDVSRAAPVFAELIVPEFKPQLVIDVGCGTGALLQARKAAGCRCVGLEYAEAGLEMCRERGIDARKFDLETDTWQGPPLTFDVAISMEVAEHLPEPVADRYIDLLSSLARVIVFTAAVEGQGGTDHVNEQPLEYWIKKLQSRGFKLEPEVTDRWRRELQFRRVASFYSQNLMVFIRNTPPQNGGS
jgi:SAM-dependent methyltransferase